MTFLDQTQDYNPLTGEIQLNPAAWGLSVQDIDSAASVELRSSLYSGNLNLTADQYREVQSLVQTKYSGVDYTGMIKGGGMTPDVSMTGRDPGLYMNQERLGYWKDDIDQWKAYIANNGNFAFKGNATNYISWDGSILTIRGALNLDEAGDPITTEVYYGDILGSKPPVNADVTLGAINGGLAITGGGLQLLSGGAAIKGGQSAYNTGSGFWLGDVSGTTKFSIGNGTKGITWDGTNFNVRGNLYAESGTFTGSITSTATITGGVLQSGTSGTRIVIESNTFKSYDSLGVLRMQSNGSGFRFTDFTGTYYSDISAGAFELSGGAIIWPYIQISDVSTPSNRIGIRTAFLTGTTSSVAMDLYLRGGQLSFRGVNNVVGSGIILTSPDDETLTLSGNKIILAGKVLYSNGTDLYWDGVKIN